MTSSYNGWPADPDPVAIGVNRSYECRGVAFPGGIKAGDVETVLGYVFDRIDAEVEEAIPGWCWGFTYKANVNNPSQLSNHSSATAGDYNAPNHPNGTSTGPNGGGGWTGAQYHAIQAILADVDHTINWLTGNDPMHFDVDCDAPTLARVADRIRSQGTEDDMTPDECRAVIREELDSFFRAEKLIVTNDRASTPNDVPYSYETALERIIRITTGTYVGEKGVPHND